MAVGGKHLIDECKYRSPSARSLSIFLSKISNPFGQFSAAKLTPSCSEFPTIPQESWLNDSLTQIEDLKLIDLPSLAALNDVISNAVARNVFFKIAPRVVE